MTEQAIDIDPVVKGGKSKVTTLYPAIATGEPVRHRRTGATGWLVEFVGDHRAGVATNGSYEIWPVAMCEQNPVVNSADLTWLPSVLATRYAPEHPALTPEQTEAVTAERDRLAHRWAEFWKAANAKASYVGMCGEYDRFTAKFDAPARPVTTSYQVTGLAVCDVGKEALERELGRQYGRGLVVLTVPTGVRVKQPFVLNGTYTTPSGVCACEAAVTRAWVIEQVRFLGDVTEFQDVKVTCSWCAGNPVTL